HPFYETIFINFVMVNQGAPRCFGHANTFDLIWLGKCTYVFVENVRLMQELLDAFDAVKDLDKPSVMLMERAQDDAAPQRTELRPLLIGSRCTAAVDDVQPRQRTDAVDPFRVTQ